MRDTTDTPDVPPEAVGQDRPTPAENRSGMGGFLKMSLAMWIVVIVVAVVFLAAIVVSATMD